MRSHKKKPVHFVASIILLIVDLKLQELEKLNLHKVSLLVISKLLQCLLVTF